MTKTRFMRFRDILLVAARPIPAQVPSLPTGAGLARYARALVILLGCAVVVPESKAEFGDVVINNFAEKAGMSSVVFPHWFHRIRFTCKVCHADLGFQFKAGSNEIKMVDIIEGRYCGVCHNGEVAWGVENCDLCHSAELGTKTQVHRRSLRGLTKGNSAGAAGDQTNEAGQP